jgi:hypothetical protein
MNPNGTLLTPHQLRLVERCDADPVRLAAKLMHDNRFHATGHGVANPSEAAEQWVRNYDNATAAHMAHCRAVLARLDRQLGIAS